MKNWQSLLSSIQEKVIMSDIACVYMMTTSFNVTKPQHNFLQENKEKSNCPLDRLHQSVVIVKDKKYI